MTCPTCGREWCNEEKGYHCLRAAIASRDEELATLRARLAEVERERDAQFDTLCAVRAALDGDCELDKLPALAAAVLEDHAADVARLTRERDEARGKALEEAARAISNWPHVAGMVRALAAKGGA